MSGPDKGDIQISLGLPPLGRWRYFPQGIKYFPILLGQHYRLKLRVDNLRSDPLKNVVLHTRISIKTQSKEAHWTNELIPVGDLGPKDRKSNILSAKCHFMQETGAGLIQVERAFAGRKKLRVKYQNAASPFYFAAYNVETWSSIVPRTEAAIALLALFALVLEIILRR